MLALLFLVFAFVCFTIAAFGISHSKLNVTALGLAFLTAYFIVQAVVVR